jgi:hypothetical protein
MQMYTDGLARQDGRRRPDRSRPDRSWGRLFYDGPMTEGNQQQSIEALSDEHRMFPPPAEFAATALTSDRALFDEATANCLDRHVAAGNGDKVAIHWEGEPGDTRVITYARCSPRCRGSPTC